MEPEVKPIQPPYRTTKIGASILTIDGRVIAHMAGEGDERKATADFIVHACNSYQDLLDQIASLNAYIDTLERHTIVGYNTGEKAINNATPH